jgi:hypothetical protein
MNWERITVNVEPHLEIKIKARAKSLRQSVSGYIASLVDRDLADTTVDLVVNEQQAPYGEANGPKKKTKSAA